MRTFLLFIVAGLISTESYSNLSESSILNNSRVEGYWTDDFGDVFLEIQRHRKGVKVRRNGRKWRVYNDMGRGVYDDCRGNVLILFGRRELEYRRKGRRPVYLFRESRGGRSFGRDRDGWRRDDRRGWNDNRGRRDRDGFNNRNLRGDWYCAQTGITISINFFNDRLGARIGRGDWTYYNPSGRNGYRDRRGNRYIIDNGDLIWVSRSGRKRHRFRKR